MLILGLILLAIGVVLLVVGAMSSGRQITSAGGDPARGEFVYASEGGVSKRTSVVVMTGWLLVVVGGALTVIALL
jgi:hypothetical protein